MPRPPAPLWLAASSRYSGIGRRRARTVLVLLAILVAWSLTALVSAGPPPASHDPADATRDRADVLLYQSVVEGVRHGGNYYVVAADAQRAQGYPLRPFVTMRLPTLAMVQAGLPKIVTIALLYLLAAGVLLAWYLRLAPAFARPPPRLIALALIGCGGLVFVRPDLAAFHEIWAGLLVALSLALWRPDRWIEAIAVAACAMLIRETAALYAIAMAVVALASGRRREAAGWGVALAALTLAVALHAHAWAAVVRASDGAGPGWSGLLGFGFFVKTMTLLSALDALPLWLGAPIIALALFGWSAWRDPLAMRALAVFAAYALLISLFCRADTYYWGLLAVPVMLAGLAFVPDAVRDLYAAGFDRRRIVVTRIVR